MRVALIGSRGSCLDISKYITYGTTEIISGGAVGIDRLAERYANKKNTEAHSAPKLCTIRHPRTD